MTNSHAPSFARLADWIEGRLSPEETAALEAQVVLADEATRANVAWLRAFARVHADTVLVSPPPDVRAHLVRRFEDYARDRRQPGFLQRLVATVTFDSGLQPATAGIRGVDVQAFLRQRVYSTGMADVVLNVRPRLLDKHFDISGQVFVGGDTVLSDLSVQILRNTAEYGITMTNDLGEFSFEAIPPGAYEIVLSADQFEIQIEPVELGP